MFELIIILWITIGSFCGVALYYALRRINQYEIVLVRIQELVEYGNGMMEVVDASGHYESDDETGFFFEELKNIQLMLDTIFKTTEDEVDATKKEKE